MRKTLLSLSLLACCSANALVTMSLWETSYNGQDGVMLGFSGSVNTTELTSGQAGWGSAFINLPYATLRSSNAGASLQEYKGVDGPSSIGTVNYFGTYVFGDTFSITGGANSFFTSTEYVSGDLIAGQSFFSGATLSAMGLTVGQTFEWTWGSGENADKVVLQVGAIPEPSTVALLTAGAAGLLTVILRRRNKP